MARMDDTSIHFPLHERVRLRNTVDPAIYGDFACVGNEGWIEDEREDRFGLHEVLVKWDINHWAYNGVQNCWAFPEHFETIERPMSTKKEQTADLVMDVAQRLAAILTNDTETPDTKSEQPDLVGRIAEAARAFMPGGTLGAVEESDGDDDHYEQAAAMASRQLASADGFIIIGVERQEHPQSRNGKLIPFAYGSSRSPEAELAVQHHLAGITASAHQEIVLKTLANLNE